MRYSYRPLSLAPSTVGLQMHVLMYAVVLATKDC